MQLFKSSIKKFYFIIIFVTIIVVIASIFIYLKHRNINDLINLLVTIVSLLIAIFAFHISLKTYVTIDSVNNISRMEGNIMENDGYRTNIVALLNQFNQDKGDEAGKELIKYIKTLFAKNDDYSGIEFANNLQKLVDVLVLFPFFFKTDNPKLSNDITKTINDYIFEIEQKFNQLNRMSSGTLDLIEETIHLIKAVICHQQSMANNITDNNRATSIQQLRGTMLKNNLSKTVYYNYFGLHNLHKAIKHISIATNCKSAWDINSISQIYSSGLPNNLETTTAKIYLEDAITAFKKALGLMSEDLMWNGFIKYNLSRAMFFFSLIRNHTDLSWVDMLNQAIDDRFRLNLLIKSIINTTQDTYLQRAFIDQEKMARLMRYKLALATNVDISQNGTTIISYKNPKAILNDDIMTENDNEFNRLGLREEILKFINHSQ